MNLSWSLTANRLPDLEELIAGEAYLACAAAATASVEDMKQQIQDQIGSGVKYPDLPNQSSAPGEAPVNQHEQLLNSIEVGDGEGIVGIGADAVVNDPIGRYLELGTSRMKPRPFAGPSVMAGEEAAKIAVEATAEKLKSF